MTYTITRAEVDREVNQIRHLVLDPKTASRNLEHYVKTIEKKVGIEGEKAAVTLAAALSKLGWKNYNSASRGITPEQVAQSILTDNGAGVCVDIVNFAKFYSDFSSHILSSATASVGSQQGVNHRVHLMATSNGVAINDYGDTDSLVIVESIQKALNDYNIRKKQFSPGGFVHLDGNSIRVETNDARYKDNMIDKDLGKNSVVLTSDEKSAFKGLAS